MLNALKADYGKCDTVPFTAGSDRSAGDVIVKNGRLGIVYEDTESGADGILITGVPAPGINIPKATGLSFTNLDEVYWDVADGNSNADSANTLIGYAYLSDGAPGGVNADTEVRVVLSDALNLGVA